MPDLYLRAATEAEMTDALIAAELAYLDEEKVLQPANGVALDIIGKIVKFDMTDPENPKPVEKPGWHVNVRAAALTDQQAEALEPMNIVPPETPYRTWA